MVIFGFAYFFTAFSVWVLYESPCSSRYALTFSIFVTSLSVIISMMLSRTWVHTYTHDAHA